MLIFHRSASAQFYGRSVLYWQHRPQSTQRFVQRKVSMNIYWVELNIHQHFFTNPPGQSEYQNFNPPSTRTQQTIRLAVSCSIFDILPEYPTFFDAGYSGKLLKCSYDTPAFPVLSCKNTEFVEKFYKSSYFGRAWYLCRGPPDCRCPLSTHRQSGGDYV